MSHSQMITPQEGESTIGASKRRNFKPVIIMLVLFSLPYFISWYYMFSEDPLIEVSTSNKGLLVTPMRALDDITFESKIARFQSTSSDTNHDSPLTQIESKQAGTRDWEERWTIITVLGASCEETCRKTLFHMGQIRKAMGVNRDKVNRVSIVTSVNNESELDKLISDYPGTEFVMSPRSSVDRLLSQLSGVTEELTHGYFLVDPHGKFMMAYSAEMPPKYLLEDMERLFKVNKN